MTWQPAPRPAWVQAVNDGLVVTVNEEATLPFDPDALLGEAAARLGRANAPLEAFALPGDGDDGLAFVEPFRLVCRAWEDEARLHLLGRWITRRFVLRLLEGRLQLASYVAADPGVLDEEVREPWFVTGAPRTGTSILHALLARDPALRLPEGWEFLRPVPPPAPPSDEAARAGDPRVALAERELRLPALVSANLDSIHEYSGRMPKECLSAHSFSFRSEEFVSRYHVPSYVAWLQRCDMRPAYALHRLVLQVLQRRAPSQWVLKSPVHLQSLPTLLDVYPDARLAVTHRDPLTVLGSVTSLVATLRWAHSDHVDTAEIGRYHADLYGRSLAALVEATDSGTLDGVPVHHSRYADFLHDPIGTVGRVMAAFGRPLSPAARAAMEAHLAANPQGKHGRHTYSFDGLGLERDAERARFARYCERFAVPAEA